jgi:hypothetical protein
MAEEQQTQVVETDVKEQGSAATSAETKNTDTQSQELMIPKHRYDEVSNKLRKLEEDAAKKAKADSEEEERRLAQQAEWQKLADQRKAKVEELMPQVELATKLAELVTEQYTAEIADWPEQVKAMAPSEDASILTKLEWMRKAKPLATELLADKSPTPGNSRRPAPISAANVAKAGDQQRTDWQKQAARRYR